MTTLENTCKTALHARYASSDRTWAALRLEQELGVIRDRDQAAVFAEAIDTTRRVRDRGDSCRLIGSACASLVAYLTGLSDVDPIEHALPWERFFEAHQPDGVRFLLVATQAHPEPAATDETAAVTSPGAVAINAAAALDQAIFLAARRLGLPGVGTGVTAGRRDDPAAFALLGTGDVEGIAQLDGTDIHGLLRARRPNSLCDIAGITAVYLQDLDEPGLMARFIAGDHGENNRPWHWLVDETLRETHGFILFQEQIMLLLHRLTEIPLADGYAFIEAVRKGRSEEVLGFEGWFLAEADKAGLAEHESVGLFSELRTAASRAVCKGHYLAQAVITYEAAYLKAHHPHEFHEALQQLSQGQAMDQWQRI